MNVIFARLKLLDKRFNRKPTDKSILLYIFFLKLFFEGGIYKDCAKRLNISILFLIGKSKLNLQSNIVSFSYLGRFHILKNKKAGMGVAHPSLVNFIIKQ